MVLAPKNKSPVKYFFSFHINTNFKKQNLGQNSSCSGWGSVVAFVSTVMNLRFP
jgi:hypothetical protein